MMDVELHCRVEDIDVWNVQMLICVSPAMPMELFQWMDTLWNTISFTSCKRFSLSSLSVILLFKDLTSHSFVTYVSDWFQLNLHTKQITVRPAYSVV